MRKVTERSSRPCVLAQGAIAGDSVPRRRYDLVRLDDEGCAQAAFDDKALAKEVAMIDAGLLLGKAEPFDELMKRCRALQGRANAGAWNVEILSEA